MVESELSQYKIVTFGGGTGQFTLLRGLVKLNNPEMITAVAATWDSGGISGELRVKEGILPPGDYFQCLLALMEDEEQLQEAIFLLRDRSEGHPLSHLLALRSQKVHHGVEEGIDGLRRLFKIRGRILLASSTDTHLHTETRKGLHFNKEDQLDSLEEDSSFSLEDEVSRIFLVPTPKPNLKVLKEIAEADKIIVSPGSPYGSIFPHLLIPEVPQTILNSSGELVVVANLMTTRGQDRHLSMLSYWLRVFCYYLGDSEYIQKFGKSRINRVIVHQNNIDPEVTDIYEGKGQYLVKIDEKECQKVVPGLKITRENIAVYDRYTHLYRHEPKLLARAILEN